MPEPIESQYFLVGHISRSHGIDGTVLVIPVLEASSPALFENVDLVRLQNERGDLEPARIHSVRVQEKEDRISFFVNFEHITDRTEAEVVSGSPVLVDKNSVEDIVSTEHGWQSYDAFNEHEKIGTVEDVIENPAHAIIDVSTNEGSLLIPCVDEYIAEVNEESEVIYCKNLDQLKAPE